MKKPLLYLAVPYSHSDPVVEEFRLTAVGEVAGFLMCHGEIVFSPISHGIAISRQSKLPTTWAYWQNFCEAYLSVSHTLAILTLEGWKESEGVNGEMECAKKLGIQIKHLYYADYKDKG